MYCLYSQTKASTLANKFQLNKRCYQTYALAFKLFYEGGPCHIGTVHRFAFKSMDCFCMTGTSVMKELKLFLQIVSLARVKYNNKTMLIVKKALFLIKTLVFLKIYLSLQSISSCTLNHFPGIWMIDIVCNCIVGYCHIRIRGRLNSSTNSLPTN